MFSSLVGNPEAKRSLERMLQEKTCTGTLLFKGLDGVGKGLFALEVAKELFGKEHAAKIDKHIHPDLHLFYPEGKTGMHPLAAIQQLIDEMAFPPFEAPYKVFILHDAERMLPSSSNALLKTLEEPIDRALLILLTSSPEMLLPTILSRCRILTFFPISEQEMRTYVETKHQKTSQEAQQIAFLAQGSLAKADRLAQKEWGATRALLVDLLSKPYDYSALIKCAAHIEAALQSEIEEEDFLAYWKEVSSLFDQILLWYRDRHLLALGGPPSFLFYQDHLSALERAKTLPLPALKKVLTIAEDVLLAVQRSMRFRHCLEYFLLKMQG
jgi:DNA polymerase III subunit delta'